LGQAFDSDFNQKLYKSREVEKVFGPVGVIVWRQRPFFADNGGLVAIDDTLNLAYIQTGS